MTTSPITISLAGPPRGKQRARFGRLANGRVVAFTPQQTKSYEAMIRLLAQQEMAGRAPFEGPVKLELRAVFDVPSSWSKKKEADALTGQIRPTKKPDIDNIAKAWNDGLNGVVYKDDAQIVVQSLSKYYGPQALVVVTVSPL